MGKNISRRSFLKGSAAGAMGLALTSLNGISVAEENAKEKDAIQWAEAADVIIVGGGGAGFCAAIEAGRAGSSVLILEKAGMVGGDTNLSNGMLMAAGTELQKTIAGCDTDTPEAFAEQQVVYAQGYGDEAMIREMCMKSPDAVQFMLDLGRVYKQVDIIPPAWEFDTETSWGPRAHWVQTTGTENSETGHFQSLKCAVDNMDNVKYYEETEVAHLIVNDAREVIGVKTAKGVCYRANKGVILATASFGENYEMSKRYNPMQYWALRMRDKLQASSLNQSVANTGDGIRMAQEIGADLALSPANVILDRMYIGGVGSGFYNTMLGLECTNPYFSTCIPGKILINNRGQRFVQEDALWGYVNQEVFNEAQRINWNSETEGAEKIWAIQDSVHMAIDSSAAINLGNRETGYGRLAVTADTLEELAEKICVPYDALKSTVDRWNSYCAAGEDKEFGRRTDFGTIETGPFVAMPYCPNTFGSLGGLRTDIETRVIDTNGNPIPRLYAAGTIMSGMFTGPFYPSCGWAILGTVHWGRKAGKNVATLDAWTTEEVIFVKQETSAVQATVGSYKAGTYTATAEGFKGDVTVEVSFSDTAITSVNVLNHGESEGVGSVAVDKLPGRIVEAQSADIDALTGATFTSKAIIAAVKDCIAQASK